MRLFTQVYLISAISVNTVIISHYFSEMTLCFLANVNSRSRSLYSISRPSVVCCLSVVCLSVTLAHPTQAVELFGNFFHHTIAQGLYFSGAKNLIGGGRPFSPEICVQSDPPPLKQRNFDQYRLIAPQP